MPRIRRATIDFETRSACNLKKSGSWRYSVDSTTEVLCLAFRLPHWPKGEASVWHPAFPHLGIPASSNWDQLFELMTWIEDGGVVEAHNAWFERGIWTNIAVPEFGWTPIPNDQWMCSAAKAASHSLPRGLDGAGQALALSVQKDQEGHTLMRKLCAPRKALKEEQIAWQNAHNAGRCPGCKGRGSTRKVRCEVCAGKGMLPGNPAHVPPMPRLWHESRELFERLWAYCAQDVLSEESLSDSLPDLSPAEQELYHLDQQINERGFCLDQEAVSRALTLIADETEHLNDEVCEVTNGAVTKGTQRARMLDWFQSQGLYLTDTQGATIDAYLDPRCQEPLAPDVRRGLELMRELGRSSTAKYQTMRHWCCPDGRVRGGLLYHGAGTGRWSGAGVQPHNFVRGGKIKLTQDEIWEDLKVGDRDLIRAAYGSVMLMLSEGLRGAICAAPGRQLYVADYAAIEARVLLWLAEDEAGLDIFRSGRDIYCEMATDIYKRPITKHDKAERQLGKATVLGCGYQMGGSKFVDTAAAYGVIIDEPFSFQVVDAYRTKFWRVKDLWYAQQNAAIEAVDAQEPVEAGPVTWVPTPEFLYCELPSGRRLAYPDAQVVEREVPWGGTKPALTYMGVNPYNRQWQRQHAYGGMLVENITQAVARDLMAEAMLRMERGGLYQPVLSVHDELIAEADLEKGDVHEFEQLMAECPPWATGCPVVAEGWVGERYHK